MNITTLRRRVLWCLGISAAGLMPLAAATLKPPMRTATQDEVRALFQRVCRQAPEKVHFRANVRKLSPPWTEEAIQEALRSQETHMERHDRGFSPAERTELRETRLESIRRSGSGTNAYQVEVWLSGELYRKDEVWTSIPDPSKWNYVILGEPGFDLMSYSTSDSGLHPLEFGPAMPGRITGYIVNETLQSVTVYTNTPPSVSADPLWDGFGLEPQFAAHLIVALMRTNELPGVELKPRLRQMSQLPLVLDESRATQLAEGSHPIFTLGAAETVIEGRAGVCFTLEPHIVPEKDRPRYCYLLDAQDPQRLYRAEIHQPGQPSLASIRTAYGADGWPRTWRSEALDSKGRPAIMEVEYLGGVDADFNAAEIFAPVFPFEYAISLNPGSGVGELIHNPRKVKPAAESVPGPRSESLLRVGTSLACLLLVWLPILVMQRKRARQLARLEEP